MISIANLTLDILLVRKIKVNLESKRALYLRDKTEQQIDTDPNNIIKDILKELEKAEKAANRMIVFSLVVNFFCRLPELALYLIQSIPFYYDYFVFGLFPLLINIIEYLYNISYIFNFLFFFKYNKKFRKSFRNLLSLPTNDHMNQRS